MKEQSRIWLEDEKLSPELIAVRWRVNGQQGVSYESLYQWIWLAKKSNHWQFRKDRGLYKHLIHARENVK